MSEEVERRVSTASTSAPTPRELAAFLPHALEVLQAPFSVRVDSLQKDEYMAPNKAKKTRTSKSVLTTNTAAAQQSSPIDSFQDDEKDSNELVVSAVHDANGRLVELAMRDLQVPCLLLKLVVLCAPYQGLLTRLTLRACKLDSLALNQLIHVLTSTHVSELSMDDSPMSCGGFHVLLEHESRLRYLSLERCAIGDESCVKLAATLHHPLPGSSSLKALSLASNGIGDAGARALAVALRSNRQLQYLNLADNRVTDAGATSLLRCLCEFSLSYEEVMATRRRVMGRLRLKRDIHARIYAELKGDSTRRQSEPATVGRGRKTRKNSAQSLITPTAMTMSEALSARAEAMAEEQLGPLSEPFGAANTTYRNGIMYCSGNWTLMWLNLAYNSLGYASLVELTRVLAAQSLRLSPSVQGAASVVAQGAVSGTAVGGSSLGAGLVRVVVEGNELPHSCVQLAAVTARIEAVLDRAARPAPSKKQTTSAAGKRK